MAVDIDIAINIDISIDISIGGIDIAIDIAALLCPSRRTAGLYTLLPRRSGIS